MSEFVDVRSHFSRAGVLDAMTKTNPNKALQTLVDGNELTVHMEGWVDRA